MEFDLKKLSGFSMSLFATRGEKFDGAPMGSDWSIAVIDALIAHNIANAAEDGGDPSEYVAGVVQMIQERALEWLPWIVFEHERTSNV